MPQTGDSKRTGKQLTTNEFLPSTNFNSPSKSPARKVSKRSSSTEMDKSQVNLIFQELKSIRESQDRMQGTQVEILQRVTNMESEITVLKSEVQEMKNEQVVTLQNVKSVEKDIGTLKFELNRLEQYSRKSSIRVYGIQEEEGERVGEQVIKKIKEEIDIEVTPEETDIVHRVGKKAPPDDVPTDVEEFLKNNYMYKYQCTETSYDKIY